MTDPATAEWREAMGASTSAQLRQTQQALAASQADLTRAEREVEGVREELTRQAETAEDLRATLAMRDGQLRESRALAKEFCSQAAHWLTKTRETARDLAHAQFHHAQFHHAHCPTEEKP
jgi:septal ring factor EnvC (AmiA/AmiB activator)